MLHHTNCTPQDWGVDADKVDLDGRTTRDPGVIITATAMLDGFEENPSAQMQWKTTDSNAAASGSPQWRSTDIHVGASSPEFPQWETADTNGGDSSSPEFPQWETADINAAGGVPQTPRWNTISINAGVSGMPEFPSANVVDTAGHMYFSLAEPAEHGGRVVADACVRVSLPPHTR